MLEAVIDVEYFQKIVESLKDIIREVYFKFTSKGMSIQSMDPSNIAFIALMIKKEGFDKYKCKKAINIGIDLEFFGNVVRLAKSPKDKLTLRLDDAQIKPSTQTLTDQTQANLYSFINVEIQDTSSKRSTEFVLKLINFEEADFQIPKLKDESLLCMKSYDFTHICKDLANISDQVSIGNLY